MQRQMIAALAQLIEYSLLITQELIMTMRMMMTIGIGLVLSFTLACGGGGDDGRAGNGTGRPQTATITGDVSAPNGLIAMGPMQGESRFFAWLADVGLWPQAAYAEAAGSLPGTTTVQQYEAFLIEVTPGGGVHQMVARQTTSNGNR